MLGLWNCRKIYILMSSKNITYKNRNQRSLPLYYGVHFACSHGLNISLSISQQLNSCNTHSFSLMFLFILEKFHNLFCIRDGSLRMYKQICVFYQGKWKQKDSTRCHRIISHSKDCLLSDTQRSCREC